MMFSLVGVTCAHSLVYLLNP